MWRGLRSLKNNYRVNTEIFGNLFWGFEKVFVFDTDNLICEYIGYAYIKIWEQLDIKGSSMIFDNSHGHQQRVKSGGKGKFNAHNKRFC